MTFRTVSGKVFCNPVPARTNLVPNPSFRGTSGTVEVRRNLCTNPSVEAATLGNVIGAGVGVTLSIDTTEKYVGTSSVKVVTDGTVGSQGVQFVTATGTFAAGTYIGSMYVKGPAGTVIYSVIRATGSGAADVTGVANYTLDGTWQRVVTQPITTTAAATSVAVMARVVNAVPVTFYADAGLIENHAALLPYFDGSTAAADGLTYSWTGTANASAAIATGNALARWGNVAAGVKGWQGADGVSQRMLITKDLPALSASLTYTTQGWPVTADARNGSALFTVLADRAVTLRTSILCYTGGITAETRSADTAVNTTAVTIKAQGAVPGASADTWRTALYPVGALVAGTSITVTQAGFEAAPTIGGFFDGNTAQTDTNAYRWSGVADASTSEELVKRKPSLLSIDGVTWRTLTEVKPKVNLLKNPSMEALGNANPCRTNWCGNPQPVSVSGWQTGTSPSIVAAPWNAGRNAYSTTSNGTQTPYVFTQSSATAFAIGERATVRVKVQFSDPTMYFRVAIHSTTGNVYHLYSPYMQTGSAMQELELSFVMDVASTTLNVAVLWYSNAGGGVCPAGVTAYVGDVCIEKNTGLGNAYFDGATVPADPEAIHLWTGTPNASSSVMRYYLPAFWTQYVSVGGGGYAYRTANQKRTGSYSLRCVSTGTTIRVGVRGSSDNLSVPGPATVTVSGYVRPDPGSGIRYWSWIGRDDPANDSALFTGQPGLNMTLPVGADDGSWTQLTGVFAVPAGRTLTGVYLSGTALGAPALATGVGADFDDFRVATGNVTPEYFDGSTAADLDYTYSWDGAALQTTSKANP